MALGCGVGVSGSGGGREAQASVEVVLAVPEAWASWFCDGWDFGALGFADGLLSLAVVGVLLGSGLGGGTPGGGAEDVGREDDAPEDEGEDDSQWGVVVFFHGSSHSSFDLTANSTVWSSPTQ